MMHLNISSRDSLHYYPKNSAFDFMIELPSALSGRFTCALLDFYCDEQFHEDFYVYCDMCEPEFIHDRVLPLLRIVSESGELTTPHTKVVTRQHIQRLHVYIRDRSFTIPAQPTPPITSVRMTLLLEEL